MKSLKIVTVLSALTMPVAAMAAASQAASAPQEMQVNAAETASPADGRNISLPDGSRIFGKQHFTVLVEGEGPDVILIPGLSTPRAVWDKTAAKLKDKYRLHIVQVRGFGDAPRDNAEGPVLEPFVAELANYIEKDIMSNNGGMPPSIIGHSMGGFSTMKLALAHPGDVKHAMVVDSLPFFGVLFGPGITAKNIEPQAAKMRDALASNSTQSPDERTLQTMSATKEGRMQVAEWMKTAAPAVSAQLVYEVMTSDIRPDIAGLRVPVTMLYPFDKEGPFPAESVDTIYTRAFESADSVTLKRIDDSRHFIMIDQPDAFAKAVTAFLDSDR